ncbi:hypothetical protein SODALDRAFT_360960 [Sodiomyces alkalinus F11]|uniref:Uncharacterized protein n=1 Tax=Sodiomyces alkalinus (strain CBS 110278 / VKM F-3762 / F11) TaxID=1314773 RepID=A0A3N2PRY0_SODAK|nr:hypothetical protein SODALDRAFT_360960 [Sodiomyces alkalinus F11]ROT37263.1 hypothetical protein SODALDRAFT_360960 [Sodiomyces alkalinus F11]
MPNQCRHRSVPFPPSVPPSLFAGRFPEKAGLSSPPHLDLTAFSFPLALPACGNDHRPGRASWGPPVTTPTPFWASLLGFPWSPLYSKYITHTPFIGSLRSSQMPQLQVLPSWMRRLIYSANEAPHISPELRQPSHSISPHRREHTHSTHGIASLYVCVPRMQDIGRAFSQFSGSSTHLCLISTSVLTLLEIIGAMFDARADMPARAADDYTLPGLVHKADMSVYEGFRFISAISAQPTLDSPLMRGHAASRGRPVCIGQLPGRHNVDHHPLKERKQPILSSFFLPSSSLHRRRIAVDRSDDNNRKLTTETEARNIHELEQQRGRQLEKETGGGGSEFPRARPMGPCDAMHERHSKDRQSTLCSLWGGMLRRKRGFIVVISIAPTSRVFIHWPYAVKTFRGMNRLDRLSLPALTCLNLQLVRAESVIPREYVRK